jgi:hypothetical protein
MDLAVDAELRQLADQLLPRLFRLHPVDDVIDALLADHLQAEVLREATSGVALARDVLAVVLRTLDAFPEIARRMRERRNGRPPFLIENEFDIQDLLYVALKPHIPDLSEEEWTPKHAGRAKRIDFISDGSRICLESKRVRDETHGKSIADELKIDIESYYVHRACDKLIAFVYDPSGYMVDAHQQELQLSGGRTIKGRTIEVIVRIRPR